MTNIEKFNELYQKLSRLDEHVYSLTNKFRKHTHAPNGEASEPISI